MKRKNRMMIFGSAAIFFFLATMYAAKFAETIVYFRQTYNNEPSDKELRDFIKMLYKKERVNHGT